MRLSKSKDLDYSILISKQSFRLTARMQDIDAESLLDINEFLRNNIFSLTRKQSHNKKEWKWKALLIRVKIWLFEGQEIEHSKPITRPVLDLRICCKISQVSALFTVKVILFFYIYRKLLTNVKDIPTTPVVCS